MNKELKWSVFIIVVNNEKLNIYEEDILGYSNADDPSQDKYSYFLNAPHNGINYSCTIDKTSPKNLDQIDYEDNYQYRANQPMLLTPNIINSTIDITIPGSSTTTIVNENVSGFLEFVSVRVQEKDTNIILEIDGVQKYDLNLKELKDEYKLTFKDTINFPMSVDVSGKHFFDTYNNPADIKNNITVKVKNNNGSSKKVYSYFLKLMVKG